MKKILFLLLILLVVVGCTTEVVENPSNNQNEVVTMRLTSSAFENNAMIPSRYTCDGENLSPPLEISEIPEGTESIVLVMDDPDIPKEVKESRGIEVFDHWTVYGISRDTTSIPEGALVGSSGVNGAGKEGYTGPCPPPEYEPKEHRYFFKVYALDTTLNFIKAPTKQEVLTAMQGHVIGEGELVGRYSRE